MSQIHGLLLIVLTISCSRYIPRKIEAKLIDYKKDELIVTLETAERLDGAKDVKEAISATSLIGEAKILGSYFESGSFKTIAKLKLENTTAKEQQILLKRSAKVKSTALNFVYEGSPYDMDEQYTSDATEFPVEYMANHHRIMQTEQAHTQVKGDGVTVAVTDTGVDYRHKDLSDNIWRNELEFGLTPDGEDLCKNAIDDDANSRVDDCNGWDFASQDNDPMPDSAREYHGSHVAGIVAATHDQDGVVGVAPEARVMAIKFYAAGKWTSEMIFNSYKYAVDNGAKIINTSFNVDKFVDDMTYRAALDLVYAKGAIVVNSAGNGGRKDPVRSILSKVLFVANTSATDNNESSDLKMRSSNWGYGIDIAAPGDRIVSTVLDDEYKAATGTSMSSPAVAGALALIWSKYPQWSREQVIARLVSTSDRIDDLNPDYLHELGAGRINLKRAVSDGSARPTSVIGVKDFITVGSKSLRVLLDGQVDWLSVGNDTVELYRVSDDEVSNDLNDLLQSSEKQEINLDDIQPYAYGSNWINITLKNKTRFKQGRYLVRVTNGIRDPFMEGIDANGDGLLTDNEEYLSIVTVKKIDTKGPTLEGLSYTGASRTVNPNTEQVSFSFKVNDDLSGVKSLGIMLSLRGTNRFNQDIFCKDNCTFENGLVRLKVPKSFLRVNGRYYISRIYLTDFVGHKSKYAVLRNPDYYLGPHYSDPLTDIPVIASEFEVYGLRDVDNTKPELLKIWSNNDNVTSGSKVIFKMHVKEEGAGLKSISANFRGTTKYKVVAARPSTVKVKEGLVQEFALEIPSDHPEDRYILVAIKLRDKDNNSKYYSCDRSAETPKIIGTDLLCPTFTVENAPIVSM